MVIVEYDTQEILRNIRIKIFRCIFIPNVT
jgi:hypothetical protein